MREAKDGCGVAVYASAETARVIGEALPGGVSVVFPVPPGPQMQESRRFDKDFFFTVTSCVVIEVQSDNALEALGYVVTAIRRLVSYQLSAVWVLGLDDPEGLLSPDVDDERGAVAELVRAGALKCYPDASDLHRLLRELRSHHRA